MFTGVDCGTRGTKALVVDDCGRLRGRGYAVHSLIERDSGARSKARRLWVADLSGAEIVAPACDEAGCLGASIQAIQAYGRAAGAGEGIAAIADVCVIDAGKATAPVAGASPATTTPYLLYALCCGRTPIPPSPPLPDLSEIKARRHE